jgi:phosphatidylserine decarboxylase
VLRVRVRLPLTSYGLREIVGGSAVCLAAVALGWLACWPLVPLALAAWAALLAFFRDPERVDRSGPHDVVSPADGTVTDIEEAHAPAFLEGPTRRVGIFMSVADVHVNRAPVTATVRHVQHVPGSFHDARRPISRTENELNLLGLELPDGRRLLVNQIAGVIARRVVCRVAVGDALRKADRFGMVKFGSRVELYLPLGDGYDVRVRRGDRVTAGVSVLATRRAAHARSEAARTP